MTKASYIGDAKVIFEAALDWNELKDAMQGFARYDGLPGQSCIQGETYSVDVTIWNIIKTQGYEIFIARIDKDACIMESREKGGSIRQWKHRLSVNQIGEHAVWADDVIIDAGPMTWFMARFAAYMYRRRHRRRKALHISTEVTSVFPADAKPASEER